MGDLLRMGEEIGSIAAGPAQEVAFLNRAGLENDWLATRLHAKTFRFEPNFGFELEGYLVDQDGMPAARNADFLQVLEDPSFVTEFAQFNWEMNGDILPLGPDLLSRYAQGIQSRADKAAKAAAHLGLRTLFIGILPTLREADLTVDRLSASNRYATLNRRVLELRGQKPLHMAIGRRDFLDISRSDVLTEAAATSLQIHMQLPFEDLVPAYNIAQIIAGPLVAACANSPFFLGKKLWDETRIPLFEQSLQFQDSIGGQSRDPVTLGQGFVKNSLMELFEDNARNFPVLLPVLFDEPVEKIRHLKLLNGQVWRWNRPIVTTYPDQSTSLRIEHRPLPAGPSVADMVANIAFYLGLSTYCLKNAREIARDFTFEEVRENFYACAKLGMKAEVKWGGLGVVNVQKLLHDVLLKQANEGLSSMGLPAAEIDRHFERIMRPRLRTGFTGAAWQKSFIDLHGSDFQKMTLEYAARQESGDPVCHWKV